MQRRHDPTYYWATRRLPAEIRPATHALYGYVRTADQIVDGPRRDGRPEARRAALDAWEAELERGRAGTRASRSCARSSTPAAATACRSASCGSTCARCGSTARRCGSQTWDELVGLHGRLGRLGRADHGAAARRPGAHHADFGAARARVPARELHPRRTRGPPARPHLPAGRGARALRRRGGRLRPPAATPELRALVAHEVRARARAVRERRARASPPRPPRCGPASGSRARSTCGVLDRVEALGYDVLGRRPRRARRGSSRCVALAALRR